MKPQNIFFLAVAAWGFAFGPACAVGPASPYSFSIPARRSEVSEAGTVRPESKLRNGEVQPSAYGYFVMEGDMRRRLERNFNRLEEERYQSDHVFLTEEQSGGWPGDTEGRTILGLVLEAQATGRTPRYLDEIIRRVPAHLNAAGYMGGVFGGVMNEQQLSGNGWLLRGLCEYYLWRHDAALLPVIRRVASLFMNGKGHFSTYSLDAADHSSAGGGASGNIAGQRGRWKYSTDVGCVFIGMDGFLQAYAVLRLPEMKPVAQEMVDRFLQMDLLALKAQTHATLTACRALLRYAAITGERRYVDEAEKRFRLYLDYGMTENYANYNWFERYDTWTEPCAIVDSYMLAVQLWQQTRRPEYLDVAERIYYNAICHGQRANGGFGCDNCPGKGARTMRLKVSTPEAYWCCTMRGGEGLSRAAQYSSFVGRRDVFITFYHAGSATFSVGNGLLSLSETTAYPYRGQVKIVVTDNSAGKVRLHLRAPGWGSDYCLHLNGTAVTPKAENGFVTLNRHFRRGDVVELTFKEHGAIEPVQNRMNADPSWRRVFYGPLLLAAGGRSDVSLAPGVTVRQEAPDRYCCGEGVTLTPVYQPMDGKLPAEKDDQKQIVFQLKQ